VFPTCDPLGGRSTRTGSGPGSASSDENAGHLREYGIRDRHTRRCGPSTVAGFPRAALGQPDPGSAVGPAARGRAASGDQGIGRGSAVDQRATAARPSGSVVPRPPTSPGQCPSSGREGVITADGGRVASALTADIDMHAEHSGRPGQPGTSRVRPTPHDTDAGTPSAGRGDRQPRPERLLRQQAPDSTRLLLRLEVRRVRSVSSWPQPGSCPAGRPRTAARHVRTELPGRDRAVPQSRTVRVGEDGRRADRAVLTAAPLERSPVGAGRSA
jgi:hypothetical protein